MHNIDLSEIHAKTRKKLHSSTRNCLVGECSNKADINAHVLQKSNKILSVIAESNHVYGYKYRNYGQFLKFEKIGIINPPLSSNMVFRGICSECDNQIFAPIERSDLIISPESFALLSYRALLKEYYYQKLNIDVFNQVLNHPAVKSAIDRGKYRFKLDNTKKLITITKIYKTILEESINTKNYDQLVFRAYSIPFIPICATDCFSSLHKTNPSFRLLDLLNRKIAILPSLFMHVIPYQERTLFIMGCCLKDYRSASKYFKKINKMNSINILDEINDLLIRHVECWFCSSSFYENHIKEREFMVLSEKEECFKDKRRKINVNMFDSLHSSFDPNDIKRVI